MEKKEVKKIFSVRLSPETIAFLHDKSRKTGKTVSEIIRSIIKKTFKKGESR
jgi:predicted DNA-binding protein